MCEREMALIKWMISDKTLDVKSDGHRPGREGRAGSSTAKSYLGKDDRSLSRYSPSAFWIFPSRSASLSRDLCTPWMLSTSITRGDLDTFFMSAKNSVLMLKSG